MHALATLTSPALSTADGVPPFLLADAAKMTADVPAQANWCSAMVVVGSMWKVFWCWLVVVWRMSLVGVKRDGFELLW